MNRADSWQNGGPSLVAIPGARRGPALTSRAIAVGVMLMAAAAAGAVLAISPILVLVACVATVATVAISSSSARFAIVIAGGLLVFGNSDQLDAPKLAYLVWVGVVTALAIARLAAERELRRLADIRPLLLGSAAVVGAIALSLMVALLSETSFIDWMRDASPYGLLAVSPFLAWDGARSRLGPHMEAIAVAAGLMTSVAFAVTFLGRRGLADLPFATLGFGGVVLPGLAFAVATSAILSRRPRRLLWVLVAATVLTLLMITGTRSSLVLLVGPIAMVLVHRKGSIRAVHLAGAVFVVGLAVLALGFLAVDSGLVDAARLTDRLDSLLRLGSGLTADASYIERQIEASIASSAFAGSPLAGVGLGFRFEWTSPFGQFYSTFNLDTGLALPAKFGVIGFGLLVMAGGAAVSFYRRLRDRLPERLRLSFVGFAAILVAVFPLGNPFEDKGLPLAVAVLTAWALASVLPTEPDSNSSTEPP